MKIEATFDRPKLERSLKTYAKAFGDTNAQAIARWGVQTCREMAFETAVFGKSKMGAKGKQGAMTWAKGKQEGAMVADALKVILIVPTIGKNRKGLSSPEAVNSWIDSKRTRKNKRTVTLPISERRICTEAVFKKAMKTRFKKAYIAKGGWLGAGMILSGFQTGAEKITIGKNFMSFAQKHSHFGRATKPQSSFTPSSQISNTAKHTASSWVVKAGATTKAINFGLNKTVKWYQSALRAQDKKQKP